MEQIPVISYETIIVVIILGKCLPSNSCCHLHDNEHLPMNAKLIPKNFVAYFLECMETQNFNLKFSFTIILL